MGSAVWEFMWCLDKITKIDDKGMGWVLGGKPINLKDISTNVDEETISRNLIKLESEGYIKKTRTPYGIVIKVLKAKKSFHKNVESIRNHKNVESRRKNVESNKTIQIDKDSIDTEQSSEKPKFSQEGADLIKAFEMINPACKEYYRRNDHRKACDTLIETYGFERVKKVIEATLPKTNKMQYMPTITTPIQLLEKWSSLEAGIFKIKGKTTEKQEKYKIAFTS